MEKGKLIQMLNLRIEFIESGEYSRIVIKNLGFPQICEEEILAKMEEFAKKSGFENIEKAFSAAEIFSEDEELLMLADKIDKLKEKADKEIISANKK